MTDRPILFSAPMIRALLAGTKAQTRRVLKLRHEVRYNTDGEFGQRTGWLWNSGGPGDQGCWHGMESYPTPYSVGDRLWVREAWHADLNMLGVPPRDIPADAPIWFTAGGSARVGDFSLYDQRGRPGIHMPQAFSRLTLTVTDVRVERLQEITEADAIAEGIPRYATVGEAREWGDDLKGIPTDTPDSAILWDCSTGPVDPDAKVPLSLDPRDSYRALWDSLNAKRGHGWAANPYVVALTFAVHHANIDKLEAVAHG